uniref:TFIIB domain-containing protein n=1 Tax=Panagrellus redivivus TaxID=6233 RepID=A0A7E4V6C6_PANRE
MDAAHTSLQMMLNMFNAPQPVRDRASNIFDQVIERKTLRHKHYDVLAAACIYYVQTNGFELLTALNNVMATSGISKKKLEKCFKVVQHTVNTSFESISSPEYIGRLCTGLDLPQTIQPVVSQIVMNTAELGLAGDAAKSVVAAAVYIASQNTETPKTMYENSEVAGLSQAKAMQAYEQLSLLPNLAALML